MTGTMAREDETSESRSLPARIPAEPSHVPAETNGAGDASRIPLERPINLPKDQYDPAIADATVVFPGCLRDERFWHVARSVVAFFLSSFWTTYFEGSLS